MPIRLIGGDFGPGRRGLWARKVALFRPEIGRGLHRQHPPGGYGADTEHERQSQPDGLERGACVEHELDIEGEGAQRPGGDGGDEDRQQRGGEAQYAEFEQLRRDDAGSRGAERLIEHGEIFAPLLARRHRARKHRGADQQCEAGRGLDRGHQLGNHRLGRIDDVADLDGGDERKALRQRLDDFGFRLRARALRQLQRGDETMGRALQRVRREHHDEIDGERLPVDLAHARDLGFDVAAENVDRDLIAELQPKTLGELAVEGNERRPVIAFRPPFAFLDGGGAGHAVGVGQAAIAGEHPAGIGRYLHLVDGDAVQLDDTATQHRRIVGLGGGLDGLGRGLEGREVVGLHVEEVIGGSVDLHMAFDLGEQRGVDQCYGDEKAEPQAPVSYTHLRAHETDSYLVCRLLLEQKKDDSLEYSRDDPCWYYKQGISV